MHLRAPASQPMRRKSVFGSALATRWVAHSACGTALVFRETARPNSVDVTVGSMDQPDLALPAAHIWTSSQLAWLRLADDLPRHPGEDPTERDLDPS